jgi:uncharacterized protein (TIGR02646 family)
MIRIQRTYPAPATLTSDKAQQARDKLERLAQAGQTQLTINSSLYGAKGVKQTLMEMQHDKCCFCESKITHIAYGDVEHFRPKKAVLEDDGHRRQPGYYWLAYTWENLLLSCEICNRRHKRDRFPIEGKRARRPEDALDQERPLFIDPAGPDDPETLITFTERGRAVAVDSNRHGETTIKALNLNRDPLEEKRRKHLQFLRGWLTVKQLAERLQDKSEWASAIQQLEQCARADAEYAGLTRSFLGKQAAGE